MIKGTTRIVFVFQKVVVKVPNFLTIWSNFLKGLIANINESTCWKWNSGKHEKGHRYLLCPVIWCSWGGWVLVMRKADNVLSEDDYHEADIDQHMKYFPGDDKPANYGMLDGLVVKIDYGN